MPEQEYDELKECKDCKEIKPTNEFPKDKYSPKGVKSRCKKCYNIRHQWGDEKRRAKGYYEFGLGAISKLKSYCKKHNLFFNLDPREFEDWWYEWEDGQQERCHYCGMDINEFRKIRDILVHYDGNNPTIKRFNALLSGKSHKLNSLVIDSIDNYHYDFDHIVKSCWFCRQLKHNIFLECEFGDTKSVINRLREILKDTATLDANKLDSLCCGKCGNPNLRDVHNNGKILHCDKCGTSKQPHKLPTLREFRKQPNEKEIEQILDPELEYINVDVPTPLGNIVETTEKKNGIQCPYCKEYKIESIPQGLRCLSCGMMIKKKEV